MDDKERGGGLSTWTVSATAVVLLYLLFPHVFILPIILAFGKTEPPAEMHHAISVFFAPIRILHDHVPAYAWLLAKESELTGID
jgi:hypothetical protein